MHKLVCTICNKIIRREVDHYDCMAAGNKQYLKIYKPKISTTDITQEINIAELFDFDIQ